jgi:cytoskeletal protein RodZ
MKNIFDTIKERLLGYKSDLDLDREWAALNQRRAKKRQQGRRRLATVLLLLLFVGSCGSLLWLKMRPILPMLTPAWDDMAQKPTASNPVVSPNPVATPPQTSEDVADSTPVTSQTKNGVSTPSTAQNTPFIPNTPERTQQANTRPAANHYKVAEQMNNAPAIASAVAASALDAPIGSPVTAPEAAANQANNAPAANDGFQTKVPTADAAPEATATSVGNARPNDNISLLPARGIAAPAMAIVVAPALPAPYLPLAQEPADIAKKQSSPTVFAVFVGGGWLGAQQHFRAADGQSEQYAALRQSTETALPSFAFNAGVQRALGKKGFVEASLYYNQSYERLNYTFERPKNYTYTNVLLKVSRIDGFGSEFRTYGDTVLAGTQTVKIVHYNQFASINLRLTLGRQLVQKGRFAFSAGAGIDGSIWNRAKGMIAAPDPTVGTLDLKEVYKNSFGLGISAVTRFEYRLHPKYALHLTPSAVWWLGNALNANGQLEAQWQQMSIAAGLTRRF